MKSMLYAVVAGVMATYLLPTEVLANPQHERMRRCNAEAKEQSLKGEERKAFMSSCLKGKHENKPVSVQPDEAGQPLRSSDDAAPLSQGAAERLQACSLAAAEQALSGTQRKAFIAACSQG